MTATTKTPAKTIFEKAYFGQGQAEAAATKEFGADWAAGYDVVRGDDKKFRVVAKPAAPVPLEAPAALVASMPVEPKVGGAKALVERAQAALHSIEKLAHDVAENLTLAQALAESGENLADLLDDKPAAKWVPGTGHNGCGYDNCPGCGVHLSNGVMTWDHLYEEHGSKTREMQTHDYACMGCGAEWGNKRAGISIQKDRAEQNGVTRPSEGGVCDRIWAECDKRAAGGQVPAVKSLKEWATDQGIDLTTCTIQYYQWRKFMGVVGRAKEMPAKAE